MSTAGVTPRKRLGAFYTPDDVARTLVAWGVRSPSDRMLDPSCGDGRFLACHDRSTGVEFDPLGAAAASHNAPKSTIFVADFFDWANHTRARFDCACGNPPFIRYQLFSGEVRRRALESCRRFGASFSALTSSWAPFLVVAANLLKPGGRMAFVVPAEIGHATYAPPLLTHLKSRFNRVLVCAIRSKIFPDLSEDAWLLYAEGKGGSTSSIEMHVSDMFRASARPPAGNVVISEEEWNRRERRLRPFLLPRRTLDLYDSVAGEPGAARLGDVARVGIGYVTGANDFFHLRPSEACAAGIPAELLVPAVRNGRVLKGPVLSKSDVERWIAKDEPVLLLRLRPNQTLPEKVLAYLESREGRRAKTTFKCRTRKPWFAVPSVHVPDGFLSYMSGDGPQLVANEAGCVGTNSVHTVRLRNGTTFRSLAARFDGPVTRLSCEIEGHPLGGGLLKLEPGEAASVVLPNALRRVSESEREILAEGHDLLRRWRHHA